MIVVSNTAAVTLTPGQALTFNVANWKSGCCESFRNLGSSVQVGQGVYELMFFGNVSSATGGTPAQVAIYADGAVLPETTMISTPATAGIFNSIGTETIIGNRANCCNSAPGTLSVSVVNTGTDSVTLSAGSHLTVKRLG